MFIFYINQWIIRTYFLIFYTFCVPTYQQDINIFKEKKIICIITKFKNAFS